MWYLKVIVIIFFIGCYRSQINLDIDPGAKCEKFTPLGKQYCNGLLPNPNSVYVPSGTNQTLLNRELELYWDTIRATGSEECKSSSNTFVTLCSFFFMECVEYPSTTPVSLPMRSCYENCQDALDICDVDYILYNCDKTNEFGVLYPDGYENFNLSSYGGPNKYSVQCFDPTGLNYKVDPSLLNCPKPLLERISDDREEDTKRGYKWVTNTSTCIIDCPASIFSNDQWDLFFRLNDSLSIISLFSTFFLVVTFVIINREKSIYDYNFSMFISGVFLMSLSGAITTFAGRKSFCPEPGRIAVTTDAICAASGFLFQFGSVLAILWFTILSFELWWAITRIKKPLGFLKYYILGTLIIAIVLSCVPFHPSLLGYQYGLGNVLCFVKGKTLQNSIFWGPLGICISIGTIFIALVCWEIYKIVRANGRSGLIGLELKPVLMILLIYFSFVYIFIFEFYIRDEQDEYWDHIPEFFDCLINNSDGTKECLFPGPSTAYYGSYIYFLRIFGIYCFIIFGISRKCLTIWQKSVLFNNKYFSSFVSKISMTTALNSKVSMKTFSVDQSSNNSSMTSSVNNNEDDVNT